METAIWAYVAVSVAQVFLTWRFHFRVWPRVMSPSEDRAKIDAIRAKVESYGLARWEAANAASAARGQVHAELLGKQDSDLAFATVRSVAQMEEMRVQIDALSRRLEDIEKTKE